MISEGRAGIDNTFILSHGMRHEMWSLIASNSGRLIVATENKGFYGYPWTKNTMSGVAWWESRMVLQSQREPKRDGVSKD